MQKIKQPPALILGGQENTLSLTRSLGRRGIPVFVSSRKSCLANKSRFAKKIFPIPEGTPAKNFWQELLLSGKNDALKGCIIFACNDDALEFMAKNKEDLLSSGDYILDEYQPALLESMLDKQQTLEYAKSVGCSIPQYWNVKTIKDIQDNEENVLFPVMIKPIHSHKFQRTYPGKKYFLLNDFDALLKKSTEVLNNGIEFMLCEMIPGSDELLSSYYTYIDKSGNHLFHFTKRVLRRFPVNHGGGSYHISEWLPDTAEEGRKFFAGINYSGFGNIEFKRDTRDGKLKVIECNARYTAAQELITRSGLDMSYLVYEHLLGRTQPETSDYKNFVRLWDPRKDYSAYKQLKEMGKINFFQWLKSISHPQTFPSFSLHDPMPALDKNWAMVKGKLLK